MPNPRLENLSESFLLLEGKVQISRKLFIDDSVTNMLMFLSRAILLCVKGDAIVR
jgi:hypothetical protein